MSMSSHEPRRRSALAVGFAFSLLGAVLGSYTFIAPLLAGEPLGSRFAVQGLAVLLAALLLGTAVARDLWYGALFEHSKLPHVALALVVFVSIWQILALR